MVGKNQHLKCIQWDSTVAIGKYKHSCCFSYQVMSDLFATPCCSSPSSSCPWHFPKQEYWSGLPFPSSGDLPDTGIELMAPAVSPTLQAGSLLLSHQGSPPFRIAEYKIEKESIRKEAFQWRSVSLFWSLSAVKRVFFISNFSALWNLFHRITFRDKWNLLCLLHNPHPSPSRER